MTFMRAMFLDGRRDYMWRSEPFRPDAAAHSRECVHRGFAGRNTALRSGHGQLQPKTPLGRSLMGSREE
jgi:hypothetical protein